MAPPEVPDLPTVRLSLAPESLSVRPSGMTRPSPTMPLDGARRCGVLGDIIES